MLLLVDGQLVERGCLPPWAGYGRLRGPVEEGVLVMELGAGPDIPLLLERVVKGHTRLLGIPIKIFCHRFPENKKKKYDVK